MFGAVGSGQFELHRNFGKALSKRCTRLATDLVELADAEKVDNTTLASLSAYPKDSLELRGVAIGKFQSDLGFANASATIYSESPQPIQLLISQIGVNLIDLGFSPIESLDPGLW
jgi:hypothetical protein